MRRRLCPDPARGIGAVARGFGRARPTSGRSGRRRRVGTGRDLAAWHLDRHGPAGGGAVLPSTGRLGRDTEGQLPNPTKQAEEVLGLYGIETQVEAFGPTRAKLMKTSLTTALPTKTTTLSSALLPVRYRIREVALDVLDENSGAGLAYGLLLRPDRRRDRLGGRTRSGRSCRSRPPVEAWVSWRSPLSYCWRSCCLIAVSIRSSGRPHGSDTVRTVHLDKIDARMVDLRNGAHRRSRTNHRGAADGFGDGA